jgi:hypothetical protein
MSLSVILSCEDSERTFQDGRRRSFVVFATRDDTFFN